MKKYLIICLTLPFIMMTSCTKEQAEKMADNVTFPSIVATVDNNICADGTKAVFDKDNRSISWELGDKIVVDGATYSRHGETNVFDYYSGGVTTTSSESQVAYYPVSLYTGGTASESGKYSLPDTYEWDKETGKVDFIPMAGQVKEHNVKFQPLTSIFKLSVKNTTSAPILIAGVSISADEFLSGKFTPTFDGDGNLTGTTITEGSTSMRMIFKGLADIESLEEGLGKAAVLDVNQEYSFYIPVPAGEYHNMEFKVTAAIQEGGEYALKYCSVKKTNVQTPGIGKYYEVTFRAGNFVTGVLGLGTASDPFILNSLGDLAYIKGFVRSNNPDVKNYFCSAHYQLGWDMVLTEPWTETMGESIHGGTMFSGVFDGQGYTITANFNDGSKNTQPMFWDLNGGVIKNLILEGDFEHTHSGCTVHSPFFYSAVNRSALICVLFRGKETVDTDRQYNVSLSIFGGVKNDCHLVGAYAECQTNLYSAMGDSLTTTTAYTGKSAQYRFMFSDTDVVPSGFVPYYVNGAVAKITGEDGDFSEKPYKVVEATTDYASTSITTQTAILDSPAEQGIVDKLNYGIKAWRNTLNTDSRMSDTDKNRFSTDFMYQVGDGGKITLVRNN